MKLPSLNVDVKVNAKNLKRDVQKAVSGVGASTGLSGATGGTGASVGNAIGGTAAQMMGMSAGASAIMGGIGSLGAAAYQAGKLVIGFASGVLTQFTQSVQNGTDVMDKFRQMEDTRASGLNIVAASRLASQANNAAGQGGMNAGYMDTFVGSSMNTQGQAGGVMGWIHDWSKSTMEGAKAATAWTGGMLGGKGWSGSVREADMATTYSAAGAQAYATKAELAQQERQRMMLDKTLREITT